MEVAEGFPCFFSEFTNSFFTAFFLYQIWSQLYIPWGMSFDVLPLLRPGQHAEQCLSVWRGGKPSIWQRNGVLPRKFSWTNIPTESYFENWTLAGMIFRKKTISKNGGACSPYMIFTLFRVDTLTCSYVRREKSWIFQLENGAVVILCYHPGSKKVPQQGCRFLLTHSFWVQATHYTPVV